MLTRFNYRPTIAAVAVAVACATSGSPAALAQNGQRPVTVYAQPSAEFRTERVGYRDLNLASPAGEKMLTKRVAGAVRRVCSGDEEYISLIDSDYFTCASGAWVGARPQMAKAIARAQEIALHGRSSIAATAITISAR